MNCSEVLRVPTGTLISGTVSIPCQQFGCEKRVHIEIQDVNKPGEGGEIDGIDHQLEEIQFRCPTCRNSYEREIAEDAAQYREEAV